MDRREVLKRLSAGAVALGWASPVGLASRPAGDATRGRLPDIGPLGVQLYTVRGEMEEDVEATLERVAAIGYEEVEFAGYFGHSPAEIRRMLERTGLKAPAAHVTEPLWNGTWARALDDAAEAGHEYVVIAWIPEQVRPDLDGWRRTAALLSDAGEQARAAGLRFAYHNHDFEFGEMEGRVPFDVFLEASDPELVEIELDFFWITHGGGDPVAFLERWPGRVPMVHVKDRTTTGEMVEVGRGALDWPRLLGLARRLGTRHFFVEHDRPRRAFRSIETSYRYLSALD